MNHTPSIKPSAGTGRGLAARRPWLLLGLVSTAALLLFRTAADFEPGRLICGLIVLYLLPGVAAAHLLQRRDHLQTIVFGLAISPLVLTLLMYIPGFLFRLPLLVAMTLAGLVLAAALALPQRNGDHGGTRGFDWPAAIPLGAGLLLALLTAAYYLLGPAHMLKVHGLYHSSGISQIMADLVPPSNIHLYGHSPAYQWPAWIAPAVSSLLLEISPPLSAALYRLTTFVGLFGLGYLLARDLGQSPAGRAFSGLLTILGMNLLGGFHYLGKLALSADLRHAVMAGVSQPMLQRLLTPEAMASHLRPRTCTIIVKLVNFSFILPGYVAVMIAVIGAVRIFKGKARDGYLLIFLGAATALLIHPVLAVILALPLPLAIFLTPIFNRRENSFPLAKLLGVAIALVFAALVALPYLLPAMRSAGEGDVSPRVDGGILFALIWLYLPLIVLATPSAVRAFKERNRSEIFIVLLGVIIPTFILVQRVKCDWYHLYMVSIPLGLLAGDQIGRWFHRLPGRIRPAGLAMAVGLLVLLTPCLRLHLFQRVEHPDEGRYRFHGSRVITLQNRERELARAVEWIREQTAAEAVLVEKPKRRNDEELSALTGRRVYVSKLNKYRPASRDGGDPLGAALGLTRRLLEPGRDKRRALEELAGLPDPIYLFLHGSDLKETLPLLTAEYAALPELVRLELDLKSVKIYRVLPLN